MSAVRKLAWLLVLALWACGAETSEATQLVLEVDSDLRAPGDIEQVSVRLEGAEAQSASADLTQRALPRSLGLVHAGGPLGPFVVHVVGTRDGAVVVEASRRVTFESGRTLHVSVFLGSACLEVACGEGDSCVQGDCQPMPEQDAGTPGSEPEAGAPDGGELDAGVGDGSTRDAQSTDAAPMEDATLLSATITAVSQGTNQRSPYRSEEPLVLRGAASVAGATLSWSDSLQGQLGTGEQVTLDSPQVGRHSVTLTATERGGRTSSATSTFVVLAPGQTSLIEALGPPLAPITSVTALVERAPQSLYIARGSLGVYELDLDAPAVSLPVLTAPVVPGSVQSALLDVSNGLLYLGTSAGLTVCLYADQNGPSDCATYQGGQLPSSSVSALLRVPGTPDRLLVGTDSGLFLPDNPAGGTSGSVRSGERAIRALTGDRNVAWLATDQGLYRLNFSGGNPSRVNAGGSSNLGWNAALLGTGGVVWLGGSAGLARYTPDSDSWSYWKASDGLISNAVNALALESRLVDGSPRDLLWVATSAGVSRFDVAQASFHSFTSADGLPSNDVSELLVMRDGTKVFATSGGLARYRGL
ncbi:MAG TPA: hypothetical protein VFZ61_12500 [Polyangiales bacterium]